MEIAAANPILVRENRVRWRGNRAFWMAFVYTAVLSCAMVWRYSLFMNIFMSQEGRPEFDPRQNTAQLGHELFALLTWMQTLGWLLLAPALTTTSIVGEREAGMLEAVLLSHLTPFQIVTGKLLSTLSFIVLIILISLPITAVCFLLGGVSGGEFRVALALHFTTALTAASVGLVASAHYRRALGAMSMAFIFLLSWNVSSIIAWFLTQRSFIGSMLLSQLPSSWVALLQCYGCTNPVLASVDLADPFYRGTTSTALPFDWPIWKICIAFQLVLAATRLWQAKRSLAKPLSEQWWQTPPANEVSSSEKVISQAGAGEKQSSQPRQRAWVALPIVSQLRFPNPVLQREVRSRFRLHSPPRLLIALFILPLALFCYFYFRVFNLTLSEPDSRIVIWWVGILAAFAATILKTTIMGAVTFTQEREKGTWESLLLSLLPTRSILGAKVLSPIIVSAVYNLFLWPLLIPCISRTTTLKYTYMGPGVSLTQAIACGMIWLGVAWTCTTWGALCSYFCRRTATAVGWALGSLFVLWVFVPIFLLWALQGSSTSDVDLETIMSLWHPLVAVISVLSPEYNGEHYSTLGRGFVSFLSFLTIGGFLFRLVHQKLRGESHLDNR